MNHRQKMPGKPGQLLLPVPVSLRAYVGTIRRAVYDAEKAKSATRTSGIRRNLRNAALWLARLFHFVKPYFRPAAPVYFRTLHLVRLFWGKSIGRLPQALFGSLFGRRHAIRWVAKRLIPYDSDLSKSKFWLGLIRLSYRLIEWRIPVVSGLTRRLVAFVLSAMLSAQLAAGHVGNATSLARLLNLAFRPYVRARRLPISFLYFQALFHSRQYYRIVVEVPRDEEIQNHYLNHVIGVSHLYSNKPRRAAFYLERAIQLNDEFPLDYRMLGRSHLLMDDVAAAALYFERSVQLAPNTVMAHQNYAGRYDIPGYKPQDWELREAGRLLIYDNYGQLAEEFFLLGDFETSFALYQKMLDYQETLRAPLPSGLTEELAALDPRFDRNKPIRLLPYEWVTQFGHIGLLDSYVKMLKLGMYPDANCVLLAPAKTVSNSDYLAYWDRYITIVRDDNLVDALFPYQRMVGDGFMAYPAAGGKAEPWTRAAARAQIHWAQDDQAPLLDVVPEDAAAGRHALETLGVPAGAWYVGLHVREGGYYSESTQGMSVHRNARIEDYLPAIKAVTDRGGYVIRLGDSTMRPLPPMPGAIDYALSAAKSPQCDIFFCATSRFVIGTTSGLTTACLSFGTPMVLVNCISNDWQLWTKDTDFIVKPVWDLRNKRYLSLTETYSPPVQGYLINSQVMRRHGLEAVPNTAAEIAEAVNYKLDLLDGSISPADNSDPILATYRRALAHNAMMFGAARPVPSFLNRHPELLSHSLHRLCQ